MSTLTKFSDLFDESQLYTMALLIIILTYLALGVVIYRIFSPRRAHPLDIESTASKLEEGCYRDIYQDFNSPSEKSYTSPTKTTTNNLYRDCPCKTLIDAITTTPYKSPEFSFEKIYGDRQAAAERKKNAPVGDVITRPLSTFSTQRVYGGVDGFGKDWPPLARL
ncbi:hypothetical protein CkaCkLH20_11439 [Colletotrichum karsti]|uniref:Uncharacterized protein n=1 Tax=Colletotrichum karsti TaxID=1095194 RepID=A0A9P6LG38_9PEZI|nr:uncharacterized protein CkaCkLH20_11439 [Colletotrichum karsti]KAF9871022.1 hypothetical protein CkaCkLH20_11439 [Colletotrichum karsti]